MNPSEWFDKAKKKENIISDYKLAKLIGIKSSNITTLRKRNKGMDNYTAIRLAEILEINRLKIIVDMEIKKAKDAEKLKFWQEKEEVYK